MNIDWHFNSYSNIEPVNENNTSDNFNNSESVYNDVTNVVRESTQNSIDARMDKSKPVKISLTLGSASKKKFSRFIDGLLPRYKNIEKFKTHLGLIAKPAFDYMLVEDSNTTGLEGSDEPLDRDGSFNGFAWSEGASIKKGSALGVWGMGKVTFMKNTPLRIIFALSTHFSKSKKEERMIGMSILGNHEYEDKKYKPQGRFINLTNNGKTAKSITDKAMLDDFRSSFSFKRKEDELGLSVVVPYINKEVANVNSIVSAILEEYGIAISQGVVEYEIYDFDGTKIIINAETYQSVLEKFEIIDLNKKIYMSELVGIVLSSNSADTKRVAVDMTGSNRNYKNGIKVDEKELESIKSSIEAGELVVFDITTDFLEKGERKIGKLAVGMKKSPNIVGSSLFRNGMRITKAIEAKNKRTISLVTINDEELSKLVRYAENPSHTEINSNMDKFKEREYTYGVEALSLVRNIAITLERCFYNSDTEVNSSILDSHFQFLSEANPGNKNEASNNPKVKTTKSPKFEVTPLNTKNGKVINVEITGKGKYQCILNYEKNRSGGICKWEDFDGELSTTDKMQLLIKCATDVKISGIPDKNVLNFEVLKDVSTSFTISNTDPNRNIIVTMRKR